MTLENSTAISSSKYILDASREYSLYVCSTRAIPAVSDGLKDGQRKALWLMRNRADKIKVVSLSGQMIQEGLYLHGDVSASDAIGKMAAPFLNNKPLLDGIGLFGTKIKPSEIGAARYVYVKKSKFADAVLYSDLDIVPLKENYDGSTMEPVTFLPIIPIVLLNGISGIAVGWSTEILPRKFEDLKAATIAAIEGKKVPKLIPCYSTIDANVKHIEGNSWSFEGKVEVIDHSHLRVVELPPDLSLEKFREHLDKLEDEGKIKSYIDKSTKQICVEVKFVRGSLEGKTNDFWINLLKLRTKKSERIVVIDWKFKAIKQYENAEDVVVDFVEWRFKKYIERYEFDLQKTKDDIEFWKMIVQCFEGNLPGKITNIANKKDLVKEIYNITSSKNVENIEKICSYPTYRWTKDFHISAKNKLVELEKESKELLDMISNPKKIRKVFLEEVKGLNF